MATSRTIWLHGSRTPSPDVNETPRTTTAARLVEVGLYRPGTWRSLNVVGNLLAWTATRRTALGGLNEQMVERYLRHHGAKQTIHLDDRAALKRWLSTLRGAGAIAPAPVPTMTPQEHIFAEFGDYLLAPSPN